MGLFVKLHPKDQRGAAKAFAWDQKWKIKASFWAGERRDDVLCQLIDEFAGRHNEQLAGRAMATPMPVRLQCAAFPWASSRRNSGIPIRA
jgi:hypothetical protein